MIKKKKNKEDVVEVKAVCPICHRMSVVVLTVPDFKQFDEYKQGDRLIQNLMPLSDPVVREFLQGIARGNGGYCRECMGELFGCTSRKILFTKEAV